MSRLTVDNLDKVAYSPWELCGMDADCTRNCRGCPVNAIYLKLAHYEDLEEAGRLIILSEKDVHPCTNCNVGWDSISADGCSSCHDNCERLRKYNKEKLAEMGGGCDE